MASHVYSRLLWEENPGHGGLFTSDPVPAGYVWVIKDIVALASSIEQEILAGLQFFDQAGVLVWGVAYPFAVPGRLEHYWGMQVLESGDQLEASTPDLTWSWRVSGYVLTLP